MMVSLMLLSLWFVPADAVKPGPEKLPPPIESIDGIYRSVTKEAGKTAVSVVTITKAKEIYIVAWYAGLRPTMGAGIRVGDTLSVGWVQDMGDGKLLRGVTVYRIEGRTLRGRWAGLPGPGVVAEDVLTWLGEMEE